MVILLTLFFLSFSFFFFPLKRKRNGLVCLSVLAWLLCPCGLSVWLCSLVFFCLAVFRCFCSVCVWAAGCVAARLCCCCTVVWGPCCVSFLLCPVFVDFGGWSHFRVPLVHVMSCWVAHAYPALVFVGWVCVWTFSIEVKLVGFFGSRGQRCPCHFLCQRSWMTCGKDINQGRLIYVPANIWDNLWPGDLVKTLVMRAPSLVCVSSCWCLLIEDGTYIIIMNLAQNVLSVLSKCVCVWNFSREVKLVPALPWQYFGTIWIYSVELLLHLVIACPYVYVSCACWKRFIHIAVQS